MLPKTAKPSYEHPNYDELIVSGSEDNIENTTKTAQQEDCVSEWFIERIPEKEEEEVVERSMAHHCFLRSLLTILHAVIGVGAGFIFIYSLIGWDFETTCLPKLVDHFADPIKFQNGMPTVCDGIVYGMGALCLINFLMCLLINCLWYNMCVAFLHLLLTTIFVAFTVLGGTTFTVYYMLWCDSMEQTHLVGPTTCEEAARIIDKHNATGRMTLHRQRMEVQQVSIWALFPLTFIALLAYSLVIWLFSNDASQGGAVQRGQYRYVIMHEDETTPLFIQNDDPSDGLRTRTRSIQSIPPGPPAAPSTNPFDT